VTIRTSFRREIERESQSGATRHTTGTCTAN
jgi:hypothetical protein